MAYYASRITNSPYDWMQITTISITKNVALSRNKYESIIQEGALLNVTKHHVTYFILLRVVGGAALVFAQ